jgi:tetratricopeptide (TPR) repeat protein
MIFKKVSAIRPIFTLALIGLFSGLVIAPALHAQDAMTSQAPVTNAAAPTASDSTPKPASPADQLADAYHDYAKGSLDTAIDKVSAIIKLDSRNVQALMLRGSIYAKQEQWDKAEYDYEVALVSDPNNPIVKFDLAELKFMQKKYDEARPGFVEIESDKNLGDFATYKVFLCDLFGAHEDVASKELDAMNQVGGNPSYYFGNAAWDLVHNKKDEASDWLQSAGRIYANAPQKIANYTSSLQSLGYLPIHSSSVQ